MLTYLNKILLVQELYQPDKVAVLVAAAPGLENLEELRSVDIVKGLLEVYKDDEVLSSFAMTV